MTRFRPFPPVSLRYGAPLGRFSRSIDPDTPLDRLAVAGPAREYDVGGAYWGLSKEGPVYAVWVRGKGDDGICYVRAKGREQAKRNALRPVP